ncbi:Na+/H+ antiporter subunit E [Palaeococcus sp. (in: euryarchaeotes)]|uniref:Na+/H+ antiporter subunit E n=1 Tax=Palaeococcus sp. (in: euryarchaeotes) TaxID=2820298 RepID=UPI000F1570FE|nr:Na+/H+ antiporter subunit E [Palaeococcus sp. (in: euryarchaeotes)]MCD6558717.1 Na+/H+ antiporter subunit E [Palaeococcus sp. (in: euryarchaeotes)]RLF77081.1 MAG: Na+/H+ antiporter subunit E [Thermococci archaeon]
MGEASKISRYLYTVIVLFVIWIFLTSSLDIQELEIGLVFSLVVGALTYSVFTESGLANFHPKRIIYGIAYIPYFLWAMLMANLDVAYRVLHPKRPINPGIVECETVLTNDVGKLVLANSITLTPGTITLDVRDGKYYIHWIDVKDASIEGASENITKPFEKFLKVIFP